MTGDLYINGQDAWITWGVNMGDGFLDAIDSFAPMKDYIENDSRLEHGKRILVVEPKVASREMTLHFTIMGNHVFDYRERRRKFEAELQKGVVDIHVPALGRSVYHLVYLGKSIAYAMNARRTFSAFSAKFEEPNPMSRA